MITVLTYGTFDLLHRGHVRILQRARAMGDRLVVGVSTDEFNITKHKQAVYPLADRMEIVAALRCVSEVFPESSWDQKPGDVAHYNAEILVVGDDWRGSKEFAGLEKFCKVVYLPRTEGISTSEIKRVLARKGEGR